MQYTGIFSTKKITPHFYFNRKIGTADLILFKKPKTCIKEHVHAAREVIKIKKNEKKKPSIYEVPFIFEFDMDNRKSMSIYDFLYDWIKIITPIIILTIIPWA